MNIGTSYKTRFLALALSTAGFGLTAWGGESAVRPIRPLPEANAAAEKEMKPYAELIEVLPGKDVQFEMVPIPGGKFTMGSPDTEAKRESNEGPQHEVELSPFWMGKHEVTWDTYEVFMLSIDKMQRDTTKTAPSELDKVADAVARPTKPYTDMSFGMGKPGYPAICMTQTAAKEYCNWISAKTGRYYRLPTEAEWEYACRAGTNTAYFWGDDPEQGKDYAVFDDGMIAGYAKVGTKKPSPWGLYDIHGNVCEWTLDQFVEDAYSQRKGVSLNPFVEATKVEPRVVRGGSWYDPPEFGRSAARTPSTNEWKQQDPQLPQSIWYYTDAQFLGLRVVRPLVEPSEAEKAKYNLDHAQKTQPREES